MNIQRKYSLPNCILLLEGLNSETSNNLPSGQQEIMSILLNAECIFTADQVKLNGGREFLENLVNAVSAYAQELLSGLRHPQVLKHKSDLVHLEKIPEKNLHRLIWQHLDSHGEKIEIDLTTVQIFDLVEVVDQFLADSTTLSDISVDIHPLPKRYRQSGEPLVERAAPATIGMTTIAIAAIAMFLVPVPQIIRQPETKPQSTPTQTIPNTTSPPATGNPNPSK